MVVNLFLFILHKVKVAIADKAKDISRYKIINRMLLNCNTYFL
jgi:hypothetical protein